MEKRLKRIFEELWNINRGFIERNGDLVAVTFLIKDRIIPIMTPFSSRNAKDMFKKVLKRLILETGVKAYIFCSDTKATIRDIKTGEAEVKECMVQYLFTPQKSTGRVLFHRGKEILEQIDQVDDGSWSDFNVWESKEVDEETGKWYEDFKEKNPELYKDL